MPDARTTHAIAAAAAVLLRRRRSSARAPAAPDDGGGDALAFLAGPQPVSTRRGVLRGYTDLRAAPEVPFSLPSPWLVAPSALERPGCGWAYRRCVE